VAGELAGRQVAFLVANEGVEEVELTEPWQAVEQAGGTPVLIAPRVGTVQAFNHLDKAHAFPATVAAGQARASDYVGLVLPGGVANPDQLRIKPEAVALVRSFVDAGQPVAAICHAPWTLIEADAVRDKTITSWPSLRTDLRNAGAYWVDEQVVLDQKGGYLLISSRRPRDLPAFCRETVKAFAEA